MSTPIAPARRAVVLVGVQFPTVSDAEHQASLAELARLVKTLGHDVVATVSQRRGGLATGAVLGEGKLEELGKITGGSGEVPSSAPPRRDKARARRAEDNDDETPSDGASRDGDDVAADGPKRPDLVVVDHELTPSQARNLERATGAEVTDRTGVIVEIFHKHAHSREAKLQVEIARLNYVAPRMRESGGADRQRGGIGGKGAGESALELDRRKIRDRVAELKDELASIQQEQSTRRSRRSDQLRVALVGYTNAGKSSLMRALTGSDVLIADKLFATLDTTVRALHPPTHPRILMTDTVGFIKKLPHDLVASFRSTLDEALEASLLLYVVDAADPTFRSQLEVTRTVLDEIGASGVASMLVLNKADRLTDEERSALASEYPDARIISAHRRDDVVALREVLIAFFERDMVETEILVPYGAPGVIGEIHDSAHVLDETYDEAGARFRVRASAETLGKLRGLLETRAR